VSKKSVLSKALFEKYIVHEKPFLNQDLRITDLVDVFHVNRTYISSFINVEYSMNFSTFINNHRMEEYQRLSKLPEYLNKSKQELVELAGFNSYRSFLRIKKETEKN
jgi:YesN/AraC family two-component response regulator